MSGISAAAAAAAAVGVVAAVVVVVAAAAVASAWSEALQSTSVFHQALTKKDYQTGEEQRYLIIR
jgi:hypothetical protein